MERSVLIREIRSIRGHEYVPAQSSAGGFPQPAAGPRAAR
jgi:hypothetical protein